MFKEIKRKITLFNILTLVAFLIILIFMIGSLVRWALGYSGKIYLKDVSSTVIGRFLHDEGKQDSQPEEVTGNLHSETGYNYVIWDTVHTAVRKDVKNTELLLQVHELEIKNNNKTGFQTFTLDNDEYRIYTTFFQIEGSSYTVQVFQQINSERSVFSYLVFFLVTIGSVGVLLLIPISSYLAGTSLKPVKEAFEMQKKFIADASHELRTPLTVIQTNLEVLRLKQDEVLADNIHWLDNIQMESETMAGLIKELLMIAQADNKKIVMEKKIFDLSALCAEVVDLMFDLAKSQQIVLRGVIPKGIEYKGDFEKLKQAIRILVDNAIKYTPGEGNVTLTLLENSRSVIIAVRDTGVGLSEEDKKKIFTRFYRVDDARNRESGGVGLGLNIAQMVAEQHGGKIEIESVPDKGSTFSIVLPRTILKSSKNASESL